MSWLPESLQERLVVVLAHFVWQGIVIAGILAAIVAALNLKRPNARYWSNLLAFAVMTACPIVTWFAAPDFGVRRFDSALDQPHEFVATPIDAADIGDITAPSMMVAPADIPIDLPRIETETPESVAASPSALPISNTVTSDWRQALRRFEPWIVGVWFCGVGILSLRLLFGAIGICRWRRAVELVPESLIPVVERLWAALTRPRLRFGLQAVPRVRVCRRVVEAVALGLFKPMILLPAAWVAELPPDMLEAALAHELAHIRRFDLWVNLLQRIVETLLFYHPAVWWLSRRLRIERELCCDDLAATMTNNRLRYAETLEHVARLVARPESSPDRAGRGTPDPALTVAMISHEGVLLHRIRQLLLVTPPHRTSTAWIAGLLTLGLVLTIALSSFVSSRAEVESPLVEQNANARSASPDPTAGLQNSLALPAGAIQRFGTAQFRVPGWYKSVGFSADSRLILVKSDNRLTILDRESGWPVKNIRLNPGEGTIWKIAVSPDGKLIAAAMSDDPAHHEQPNHRIVILDATSTRRLVLPWTDLRGDVELLSFSRDNKTLVAGSERNGLRFWNLESGNDVAKSSWSELAVRSASFSPDGQTLVVVGRKKSLIWKWQTSEVPRELARHPQDRPLTVTFSPDGKWFAVGYAAANGVRVFDATTGEMAWQIDTRKKSMYPDGGIAFTSDSQFVAVPVTQANAVELWSLTSRDRVNSFAATKPRAVAISGDDLWLAAGGSDSVVNVWNLTTREPAVEIPQSHNERVGMMRFTPDGRVLASASDDGTVRLWDVATGQQTQKLSHNDNRMVRGLAVSPDGRLIVSSSLDNTVVVWERSNGKRLLTLPGHAPIGGSRAVQFALDGSRFATWGDDATLRWWETRGGKLLGAHPILERDVALLGIQGQGGIEELPKGQITRNASTLMVEFKGELYEFDSATGKQRRLISTERPVANFALSPDECWLATVEQAPREVDTGNARTEYRLLLRNFVTLEALHQIADVGPWSNHTLAFSPDSRWLAYIGRQDSPQINVVNVETGKLSARIDSTPQCTSLQFSPDGKALASAHANTTIMLWDLSKVAVSTTVNANGDLRSSPAPGSGDPRRAPSRAEPGETRRLELAPVEDLIAEAARIRPKWIDKARPSKLSIPTPVVALCGLVPIAKQAESIAKSLDMKLADARNVVEFVDFDLQRQECQHGEEARKKLEQLPWKTVSLQTTLEVLDRVDFEVDPVPATLTEAVFTMPLPKLVDEDTKGAADLKRLANHPRLKTGMKQKSDWRLFRFLDFSVEPGHSYRYRVRLVVRNPAFQRGEPNETVATAWSNPSPAVDVSDSTKTRAGHGSSDPAPTAGLPNSDDETNPTNTNNANGDLRSNPAVGSGDPRRAQSPLSRIVSIRVTEQDSNDLRKVLTELCRQAELKLNLDDFYDGKPIQFRNMPIEVEHDSDVHGPLEFVLSQVLNPTLAFEVAEDTLRVDLRWTLRNRNMVPDRIDLVKLAASVGPTLKQLRLSGTQVTDDDLRQLANFPALEKLRLDSTAIHDAGLKHIAQHERLTTLVLGDFITDDGLKALAKSQSIRTLVLLKSRITDAAAEPLIAMPQLESLSIQWSRFGDAGMKRLAAADKFRRLSVESSLFTNACAEPLAGCRRLRELNLLSQNLTSDCLVPFERMTWLTELSVSYPEARRDDFQSLRAALPKTNLRHFALPSVSTSNRSCEGHVIDAQSGRPVEHFVAQFGRLDPVDGEVKWEPPRPNYSPNVTGRFGVSGLQLDRRFRLIADGYEPVEITSLIANQPDAKNDQVIVKMRRIAANGGTQSAREASDLENDSTKGLPNSDDRHSKPNNANGDLRADKVAGSGDPRRALDREEANDDPVAAVVNGVEIRESEVLEPFGEQLAKLRETGSREGVLKARRELIEQHLKRHIEQQLLVQESNRTIWPGGREQLDEYAEKGFEEHLAELKKDLGVSNLKELKQQLQSRGSSLAIRKSNYFNEIHASQFIARTYQNGDKEKGADLIDDLWKQAKIKTAYDIAKGRGFSDELRDWPNQRIRNELLKQTEAGFINTPLSDVLTFLSDYHNIVIRPDVSALPNWEGLAETPITLEGNDDLVAILGLILEPLRLTYRIEKGKLLITTNAELERRGEKSPVSVTATLESLAKKYPDVKWLVLARGHVSNDDAVQSLAGLVKALSDEVAANRRWAVKLIGQLGESAKPAIPDLAKLTLDGDAKVRRLAYVNLVKVSLHAPEALKPVMDGLRRGDSEATAGLGTMPVTKESFEQLIDVFDDPKSAKMRSTIAVYLFRFGNDAIPVLKKALTDPELPVRMGASRSLHRLRVEHDDPKNAPLPKPDPSDDSTPESTRAGRGAPAPAPDPTAGLPNSDEATNPTNNANGDLRSKPAAGSGDPRRAPQELLKPKGKEALSLFKAWQEGARANGNIPGGALRPLVRVMTNFVKNNPTHEGAPKFTELLKRIDTSRDWTPADAVALLDEVTAIYASLPEWVEGESRFTLGGAIVTGQPLTEELKNAPWGEAESNGLRVAWLLEPRALKYRLGTPLKSRILFHNAGKDAVVFRALTWNQSGNHKAHDAEGKEINIVSTYWTTIPRTIACRLGPGEFLEVTAAGIGVGANKDDEDWRGTRVGSWIEVKEGDEVTFTLAPVIVSGQDNDQPVPDPALRKGSQWWLNFITNRLSLDSPLPADAAERRRLLDRAMRDLFGNAPTPEEITTFTTDTAPDALDALAKRLANRPGCVTFSGSLKSGTRKFLVLPVDPDAAKKPRTAKNPGQYRLGGNATLVVVRRPIGERIVNDAHLAFSPTDATKPAPREPHKVPLPDGYDTWAAAWERGATVLWVQQEGSVRRYDFTNPAQVKETQLKPGNILDVPEPLREALKEAFDIPGAPQQRVAPPDSGRN